MLQEIQFHPTSIGFSDPIAIFRYQYSSYARYQNLNNSLDIYVKTASLITYRIMQIRFIRCSISNVLILSPIMIYTLTDIY